MAGLKEVRSRLVSVKNTKKITYAMKLVSAAKLRKAQDATTRSREYTELLRQLAARLQDAGEGNARVHPLMKERKIERIAVIVIGGSRGLAGGYNANLGRRVESTLLELRAIRPSAEIEVIAFGRKAVESLRRMNRASQMALENLSEDPTQWPLTEVLSKVENDFREGRLDAVHLIYTKFKSALSSTPVTEQLLPLSVNMLRPAGESGGSVSDRNLLFEPTPEAVFDQVVPRVFRSLVLQGALDAKASEHGSRMAAMDAATKNAGDLIRRLQLRYNKLRQSGITSELLDIIGGSEALG